MELTQQLKVVNLIDINWPPGNFLGLGLTVYFSTPKDRYPNCPALRPTPISKFLLD